jgi:hypothetical protein
MSEQRSEAPVLVVGLFALVMLVMVVIAAVAIGWPVALGLGLALVAVSFVPDERALRYMTAAFGLLAVLVAIVFAVWS